MPINKFALLNVEGLKTLSSSAVSYLGDTLTESNLLFLMLTETWLRDHLDAEVKINSYTIFRTDRTRPKKKRGRNSGGVAIYVRDDLAASCEVLFEFSNGTIEAICLSIKQLNLVICTIYRPPDNVQGGNRSTSTELKDLFSQLTRALEELPSPMPTLLVAGDFNLPKTDWPSCTPRTGATSDEKSMVDLLADFKNDFFLHQTVDAPTHCAGNILDLILVNDPSIVLKQEIVPTSPVSTHHLIMCDTTLASTRESQIVMEEQNCFDKHNLISKKVDWNQLSAIINSVDWASSLSGCSPTDMLQKLLDVCEEAVVTCCPLKSKKKRRNPIPRQRRVLMRKRTKLRKSLLSETDETRRTGIKSRLVVIEGNLQASYKSQHENEEKTAVEAIKDNPKFFYAYAKDKHKLPSTVGPFLDEDGRYVSDPRKLANMLSNQYKSVFSTPANVHTSPLIRSEDSLEDFDFTEIDIREAINEVGTYSAAGPDRFPAILLKNCKEALAHPLAMIWRRSLDSGEIPTLLKTSVITPIHKGGGKQLPKNYRPVALTSHLIKVFEKVLRRHVVRYIEERNLLNPNQHGFRAGRSCLSQLVQHYDKITKAMEEGKNVDVIYLDYAKAFDKLDFDITLQKLNRLGISGRVYAWINSFLNGRKQIVHVKGAKSDPEPVISGVPQGSVIGPLLFLILLGDIDEKVTSASVSSFADDTRVMGEVRHPEDVSSLQRDLDAIYEWSAENNTQLNAEKFDCMRYGYDSGIKTSTCYTASDGSSIHPKDTVKDLGVLVSSDGSFREQVSNVVLTANLKCAWVLRTFSTRERKPMLTLWRALVLPILDYCCQLWSPAALGQINALEKVQSAFFKKIAGLAGLDYWQQLSTLHTYSLQRRRERYIVIYVWKVLEGLVPNFGLSTKDNSRHGRYCLVPHIKSGAPVKIQNMRFASLSVNGPRLFNVMPNNIRNMTNCSVDCFKGALDRHLKTVADEPRVKELTQFCSKASNSLLLMKPQ